MTIKLENPAVILIFGANGAGKSTLGRELAGRIDRCAYIEVDELRYKVAGGLVAYSGPVKPWEDPEESKRQAELGLKNAVILARSFAESGFSSVIDGLERDCLPGSGWPEAQFPDLDVYVIAVVCDEATFAERWNLTDWPDDSAYRSILEDLAWYRSNGPQLDAFVDTTALAPEAAADAVVSQLFEGSARP